MRFLLLLLLAPLYALEIPQGGTVIHPAAIPGAHLPADIGSTSVVNGAREMIVRTPQPDKPYAAQFHVPLSGTTPLKKGSPILVVIEANSLTDKAASIQAKLQLAAAPYTQLAAISSLDCGKTRVSTPILLIADQDVDLAKSAIVLFCGHQQQSLAIASVAVHAYPPGTDVSNFPRKRITYDGREPDAPWRKAAQERIEKHRKADLTLTLKNADGTPVSNEKITINLRRHAFGFGSAVTSKLLLDESEDGKRYRDIIDQHFSMVVFENDFKDYAWDPKMPDQQKQERNANMERSLDWLEKRNISIRGHYLMQTATPQNLHGRADADVRTHYLDSTRERLAFAKDRVCEWDVINHPVAWHGADMLTKRPTLARIDREVFTLARQLSDLPMCVNEDQIYRPGNQSDDTFAYMQGLIKEGFKIGGFGNQAHFDESYLPTPMHMLEVSDRFARIVPRQVITEFDVTTTADEELAADFTRDVLTVAFSHPSYYGFTLWGFWEGSHWKPNAASWNKDWTIRKRGEVFTELVSKTWHTEATITTDANGNIIWRGFPGWYEVTRADGTKQMMQAVKES